MMDATLAARWRTGIVRASNDTLRRSGRRQVEKSRGIDKGQLRVRPGSAERRNVRLTSTADPRLRTERVTFAYTANIVRAELGKILMRRFGQAGVDLTGKKAIKVHGLDGSRADCDIVPAFHLRHVCKGYLGQLYSSEGVAILGTDGSWTFNFPDQHHANGVAKRANTAHRFKRNVRMLKRLNYELQEIGDIPKRLPSFLVECLVYRVEDAYFLIDEDDRYHRLLRIYGRPPKT